MTLAIPTGKSARSIVESNRRLNLWHGSVRSTKTTSSLIRWCDFVANEAPPEDLFMIGKTERTVERNVINPLKTYLGQRAVVYNRGRGEVSMLGRRIFVVGAPNALAEEKLRGPTAGGIYGDEITTWPEEVWNQARARMSVEDAKLFGTTNTDSPYHWLKKDTIDREAQLDAAIFHFTLKDNPHLPPSYVRQLAAEYGGPGTLWHKRFIDGMWVAAEGAIYDMWTDVNVVHELPPPEAIKRMWLGIDYGTRHPFVALLLMEVLGHIRRGSKLEPWPHILVAREWRYDPADNRGRTLTNPEYSKRLRSWLRYELPAFTGTQVRNPSSHLERIYVDPSALSFITQLERDGFNRVWPADNSVTDGIQAVASLIPPRRLLVHASCEQTIRAFPGYVWDDKAQKRGEDRPVKANDDEMDALRYGAASARRVWREWVADALEAA